MTIRMYQDDYVITDRGGIVENRYNVHAAVVDVNGRILYAVGDPQRVTLARSAAKPAQALAILETGAFQQYDFTLADLALMCASHNSEDKHLTRAKAMLEKLSLDESHLRCGGHPAITEAVNRSWIKADFEPTPLCNNCSGKHAGMLAGAKTLEADLATYHLPKHPMQARVKQVFEELSGLAPEGVGWGIDGCNLPAPACPLFLLAKIYAFFADSATNAEDESTSSPRAVLAKKIFEAMSQHPDLIAGEGRFCTKLMQAFDGDLIGKLGADGCYGIGIRQSEQTRRMGVTGGLGIAVKIEDGNINILYSAVMEILQQLGIGTQEQMRRLESFHRQEILNTVKVVTGHVSHHFNVRPIEQIST